MTDKPAILLVDDESCIHAAIRELLAEEYEVRSAYDPVEALELLKQRTFDCVLLDLRFRDKNGADLPTDGFWLLREVRQRAIRVPFILLSVVNTGQAGFDAGALGAAGFVSKPWGAIELRVTVERAIEHARLERRLAVLEAARERPVGFKDVLTRSARMEEAVELARRVCPKSATVLIQGETGTGKGHLAKAVHNESPRRGAIFHVLNCATLPPTLAESELFGHEKGAFTGATQPRRGWFELADGGTLFLDDITELTPELQGKLLQALEEKTVRRIGGDAFIPVDVRIIAATNRDLRAEVAAKRFREDLYHRLNLVAISLPPLREREGDVPLLADHFLAGFAARHHRPGMSIGQDALQFLSGYAWPGNVRELMNFIERCALVGKATRIGVCDLPPEVIQGKWVSGMGNGHPTYGSLEQALENSERQYLLYALVRVGWNQTRASEFLKLDRATLFRKMQKYDITPPESGDRSASQAASD